MNQIWTLHIENFARIKEADITISPLMCFVGDNNSGKSYVMSLLWGIMSNEEFFFSQENVQLESYKTCKDFILTHTYEVVSIDQETAQTFVNFFNDLLNSRKDDLVSRIFNHNIVIDKLEIRNFISSKDLSVKIKRSKKKSQLNFERKLTTKLDIGKSTDKHDLNIYQISVELPVEEKYIESALWKASIHIAFNLIMFDWLTVTKAITEAFPIYLPASRTGFLMTYRQIASGSLKGGQPTLTLPYVQFLQLLLELTDSDSQVQDGYKELVNFIRSELLHGTIKVKK